MNRRLITLLLLLGPPVLTGFGPSATPGRRPLTPASFSTVLQGAYGRLPLAIEPNLGQVNPRVKALCRPRGCEMLLGPTENTLALWHHEKPTLASRLGQRRSRAKSTMDVLRLELKGADASAPITFQEADRLPGVSNYFIGNNPAQWRANVPHYSKMTVEGVYPGIDLVYHENEGRLEHDFKVSPGSDPGKIQWEISGALALEKDGQGGILLRAPNGQAVLRAPQAHQTLRGQRRKVEVAFALSGTIVKFKLGDYDKSQALIIDPVLVYSTYLGGSLDEEPAGIKADSAGNAYIVGTTDSANFPTLNPLQATLAGSSNVFVTKLNPSGNALVYSTYLGGSALDDGLDIALDSAGNAYVTGSTTSKDFPLLNPIKAVNNEIESAFVTKINPSGNALVYSTYLGGSDLDSGGGIAVDPSGDAFVVGFARSKDFPVVGAFQAANAGVYNAFISELNPAGNALVYSTYLGGTGFDYGSKIALDSAGDAYVTGTTTSTDFPLLTPYQAVNKGNPNSFVSKLNPAGNALVFSTYLGGSGSDNVQGIAVDASNAVYLAGATNSTDFPVVNPFQAAFMGGLGDGFVTKFNPAGDSLAYSTYLGSSGDDLSYAIAVDAGGEAFVVGTTDGPDFPLASPTQTCSGSGEDATFSVFAPSGNVLLFSTCMTGSMDDGATGVALDSSGGAYLTGPTQSTDFPTLNPYQGSNGGSFDGFVAKFFFASPTPTPTPGVPPTPVPTPGCAIQVWPDPFNPPLTVDQKIKVGDCLPPGAQVSFYTISGELVGQEAASGGVAKWDGQNQNGVPVSSGVYYYVAQSGGTVLGKGKFLLVR